MPSLPAALFASAFEHPGDGIPEPGRQLGPDPPKHPEQDEELHESELQSWIFTNGLDACCKRDDGSYRKKKAGDEFQKILDDRRPQGRSGLRRREIPAAALGADIGVPGIGVPARAELHVVATAAEVAVARFARRDLLAVVAVAHGI